MKKLAVIGNPISHSLSPAMHNAALNFLGINSKYIAINLKESCFGGFISRAKKEFSGFNVTVPYKTAIIPFLDVVEDKCLLSQSVNTVVIDNTGKLHGKSTDGYGLEKALGETFHVYPTDIHLFFIGCGGAAKAAATHFLRKGVKNIMFANRTVVNAARFVNKLAQQYSGSKVKFCSLTDHEAINRFLDLDPIVVQSTSLGISESDLSPLAPELFRDGLRVFDMIYHKTNFLRTAETKKCICSDGHLMLLYQGARSFYFWTGIEAPIELMKKTLLEQLSNKLTRQ
jgi:shikimate dehydrogenase